MVLKAFPIGSNQALGIDSLERCDEAFKKFQTPSSLTYILALPSSSLIPINVKKERSCFATPIPADPAPKNRILCSKRGFPDAAEAKRAAFIKPERTTAPSLVHRQFSPVKMTQCCWTNLCLESAGGWLVEMKGYRSRTGTTHIVVKATVLGFEHVEVSEGIVRREVFKLDEERREDLCHGIHKFFHERIHLAETNSKIAILRDTING